MPSLRHKHTGTIAMTDVDRPRRARHWALPRQVIQCSPRPHTADPMWSLSSQVRKPKRTKAAWNLSKLHGW